MQQTEQCDSIFNRAPSNYKPPALLSPRDIEASHTSIIELCHYLNVIENVQKGAQLPFANCVTQRVLNSGLEKVQVETFDGYIRPTLLITIYKGFTSLVVLSLKLLLFFIDFSSGSHSSSVQHLKGSKNRSKAQAQNETPRIASKSEIPRQHKIVQSKCTIECTTTTIQKHSRATESSRRNAAMERRVYSKRMLSLAPVHIPFTILREGVPCWFIPLAETWWLSYGWFDIFQRLSFQQFPSLRCHRTVLQNTGLHSSTNHLQLTRATSFPVYTITKIKRPAGPFPLHSKYQELVIWVTCSSVTPSILLNRKP
ncbi:hypothetical protein J6590_088756 [Homalodisca vitripennis]|nr:hypothetical protein J6590_088756 [Homalodisca vitripennis]